jgi:succinate dehydrogenase/fumarate reductase flavoprotein subunit
MNLIEIENFPFRFVHTLVIGSGAAGLAAAVALKREGIDDILIVTEGLDKGTSINTGSDKQTYYKQSLSGSEVDSPRAMAQAYFDGGAMHGDLALVESAVSVRAFMNLVELGVPFPRDRFGQFVGYKTDHDPRQRATSIGPYTSREMCRALIAQVGSLGIEVCQQRWVIELLTDADSEPTRVIGAVFVNSEGDFETIGCENIIFAAGGPGGLYRSSVYPAVHNGAIGVALRAGAMAHNLPESQFGIASVKFRWNLSGTFMQVMPKFVSTVADGVSEPREFMQPFFDSPGHMNSTVFLKGYQWPFDAKKVIGGSSLIDLLVYRETVVNGRRVFVDYRSNPAEFDFDQLSDEARDYLAKSDALLPTPFERLEKMNPTAIDVYRDNQIDLANEPLEIAVAAQHNNGGLAGNIWYESVNLKHLFPIGEVNGSHGVARPGGSALNAGQVGAIRAAEFIANRYRDITVEADKVRMAGDSAVSSLKSWYDCDGVIKSWAEYRTELQERMTKFGAEIRDLKAISEAEAAARRELHDLREFGCKVTDPRDFHEKFTTFHLLLAQVVYLSAIRESLCQGVGSRSSSIVIDPEGQPIHPNLEDRWRIATEDESFRNKILQTRFFEFNGDSRDEVRNRWVDRRPIPDEELWFENVWRDFDALRGGLTPYDRSPP